MTGLARRADRRWSRRAVLVAAVAALGVMAGCANAVNTGPLGNGGGSGEVTAPVCRGGVLSYGFQSFRNSGPATAVVEKVSLDSPRHLRMLAAYIVAITGYDLFGVLRGFPSAIWARHPQQGVQWPKRQRAGGALLPPSPRPAHDVYNLVLVVKPAGNSGTARAIDIWYRESGQQYHMRTGFTLKVFAGRC